MAQDKKFGEEKKKEWEIDTMNVAAAIGESDDNESGDGGSRGDDDDKRKRHQSLTMLKGFIESLDNGGKKLAQ